MAPRLSLVIPVLNEAESLRELFQQVTAVAQQQGWSIEVVFVDDGSRDASWSIIQELAKQPTDAVTVHGIRFRRNFGKAAALTAGMRQATAPLVMTMDADLQDDPAEIPRFIALLEAGHDVVNGWKERRLDPWHKVYPSRVFNWLVSRLTGLTLHDHNCGIKLLRAEVCRELRLYGEMHRFIPVLAHARGFRVTELAVHHRARIHGSSKYGWRRFQRGFLDLLTVAFLTGFGRRPQHLLGAAGLAAFGLGTVGLLYLAGSWLAMNLLHLWEPVPIGNRPLLAYSIAATLLGAQAISLGLLAELIVHNTTRDEEAFSISDTI